LHLYVDISANGALLYIGRCKYGKTEGIEKRKELNTETGC
jgi:hypothetical protein